MFYHFMRTTCLSALLSLVVIASAAELPEGVRRIKVLNYAGCFVPLGTPPVAANGHGPSLDTELWISRDGLNWDRPFRGINLSDAGMVEHNPMVVNGKLLFHHPMGKLMVGIAAVMQVIGYIWIRRIVDIEI